MEKIKHNQMIQDEKIQALFKRKEAELDIRVLGYEFDKHKNIHILSYSDKTDTYQTYTSYFVPKSVHVSNKDKDMAYLDFFYEKNFAQSNLAEQELQKRVARPISKEAKQTFEEELQSSQQFKEAYSQQLLQQMKNIGEKEKSSSEETLKYTEQYKQNLLKNLGLVKEDKIEATSMQKPVQKSVEKVSKVHDVTTSNQKDPLDEKKKVVTQMSPKDMANFEKKHAFETVYVLKKEVIEEIKQLPLSESQRDQLARIEQELDRSYEQHLIKEKEEKATKYKGQQHRKATGKQIDNI